MSPAFSCAPLPSVNRVPAPHGQSGSKAGLLCCVDLVEAIYIGDSFDPVEAQASFYEQAPVSSSD